MNLNSTFTSIKTDVDLSEVPPLNRRRLVAFVNYFLMKNTEVLNSFATKAEDLLLHAEKQLRVTDKRLKLLEEKLMEIKISSPVVSSIKTSELPVVDASVTPGTLQEVKTENSQVTTVAAEVEVHQTDNSVILIKDEPALSKYFKMLKVGIAEQAVKIKMASEGFDPKLLDTPNDVCPPQLLSSVMTETVIEESSMKEETENKEEEFDSDDDSISSFSD